MKGERYYEAKKYAHSLDYSYRISGYENYHRALLHSLYGSKIDKDVFARLIREAGADLSKPDAVSERPHKILWWNVDLPGHVLIAKHGERDMYWAFTAARERIMTQVAEAMGEAEAQLDAV